jgi:hypothetical protein
MEILVARKKSDGDQMEEQVQWWQRAVLAEKVDQQSRSAEKRRPGGRSRPEWGKIGYLESSDNGCDANSTELLLQTYAEGHKSRKRGANGSR